VFQLVQLVHLLTNQRLVQESWIAGQRGYNVESCPPLHLLSCTPVGGKAKLILAFHQRFTPFPPLHLRWIRWTGGTTAYPFPPLVHTFHLLSQLVHLLTNQRLVQESWIAGQRFVRRWIAGQAGTPLIHLSTCLSTSPSKAVTRLYTLSTEGGQCVTPSIPALHFHLVHLSQLSSFPPKVD
jgi:hypothetical protein